ncbi:MAG: sel1 repeat family protein [Beijerinckiaceae bacterium]|nr:sel1 repeat family protein [Beijerinckiaceae bacterium]
MIRPLPMLVSALLLASGAAAQDGPKAPDPAAKQDGTQGAAPATTPDGVKAPAASSAQPAEGAPGAKADGHPVDLMFGAFQRGLFLTAMEEALKRVKENPNDGPAMTMLGELYRDGLSVRRNPVEAVRWYRLAAERGDRQAQFAMGVAHLNGVGAPKDKKAAREWLQKAAAQNHGGALYNLGVIAIDNDIQDFPGAAALFRKAAELGDMDAAYGLSVFYREGTGVPRDKAESIRWLQRAAQESHVAAMVEFAVVVFNGDGVEKNEAGAAKLFGRAAQANSPVAQNRLARMFAAGRGVRMDMVEAMKWHVLARANGVKDDWLDARMATLSAPERVAVEEAVQRYIGN